MGLFLTVHCVGFALCTCRRFPVILTLQRHFLSDMTYIFKLDLQHRPLPASHDFVICSSSLRMSLCRLPPCHYCYFILLTCPLRASLIQAQPLTLAEKIFSARELKPVKYLKLFKMCVPSEEK